MRRLLSLAGRKKIAVKRLMNKIFIYSAIKMRANVPPLYSVLKPETSSDSPSAKSKGARFVSAKAVTNQILSLGIIIRTNGIKRVFVIEERLSDIIRTIGLRRIKIILTS